MGQGHSRLSGDGLRHREFQGLPAQPLQAQVRHDAERSSKQVLARLPITVETRIARGAEDQLRQLLARLVPAVFSQMSGVDRTSRRECNEAFDRKNAIGCRGQFLAKGSIGNPRVNCDHGGIQGPFIRGHVVKKISDLNCEGPDRQVGSRRHHIEYGFGFESGIAMP